MSKSPPRAGSYQFTGAKSHNKALIVLRALLGLHFTGVRAAENPAIGLKNRRVVKRPPDPHTSDERDRILQYMRERYDARVLAYFQFAMFTVRISDQRDRPFRDRDRAFRTIVTARFGAS